MKKLISPYACLVLLLNIYCGQAGSANKPAPAENFADIKFRTETADLGKIAANVNANCTFIFSNTGNSPLTITEARGNCHCVQAKWPETPINPGDSAVISVSFDPTGIKGLFIRTVDVHSNAKRSSVELKLSGEVLPGPDKKQKKS